MTVWLRIALLILGLTASACTPTVVGTTTPSDSSAENGSLTPSPGSPGSNDECEVLASDVPWASDVAATAVLLSEGSSTAPRVEAVIYPHPDYEGKPWSQWGQGLVLDGGRHLSAIGDHRGPDGNSYLFEYDPSTKALTQIVDLLAIAAHTPGDWGFGKVHAQMVQGPCDTVMVATYWGTRREIEFTDGYQGDVMVSLDPQRRTAGTRGVIYPLHGVPSLAGSPDRQLLYSEAVDPTGKSAGVFVVQDAADGTTIFVDDNSRHTGYRSIGVDAAGRAFYSIGDGMLAMYDPASNASSVLDAELPGAWLRAVSKPDGQGTLYGVTRDPEFFFSLDPDGNVQTFTEAPGYTTSVALSPTGSQLYSVPEAHGKSWQLGAPLLALDTATGDLSTVVELQPLAEEHLGLRLGGTYNVAIDRLGKTIYVGMNASQMDDDSGFGEVVLIIVTLP
jgi:hypothetical protein